MVGNTLIENTAKWIVREWKDDLIFPNYLKKVSKELKEKLVSYYITWILRSCNIKKAFLASKFIGEQITESELKNAKDYIVKNGKYANKKQYLTKEDLINLNENGIKISKSEALNLFKLQQFKFEELAGVLDFFEDKEEPIEVYLNLYIEMCNSAIEKKDLNQFSSYFPMLLNFPIPEKINSLAPKVNSFYLGDWKKLFGKLNKSVNSFKKKTIGHLSEKVDNWLNLILVFYPDLIKEKKDSRDYSYILGNIVEPYLKYFKYSKTTVDKMGYIFISNNLNINPWKAMDCFNASNNKKMKNRLELFSIDWKAAESFSQEKLEKILQNALKEADLFSKEKLHLLAFKLLESAQSLVDRNRRKVSFINDIIEQKIKFALALSKNTGSLPTTPIDIMNDIEKIGKEEYYITVLNQMLLSNSYFKTEFVSEFFSKHPNLFDKDFIIRTIENLIKDRTNSSNDYYIFKVIENQKNSFSKNELESLAKLFESIHNYYYAIKTYKLLDPELANLTEELRKNNPRLNLLDLIKKENIILSKKSANIRSLLKKQEQQSKDKRQQEINEKNLSEDLDKSTFYVMNPKYFKKRGIIKKISGDSTFKRLYSFIENAALLKEQISAIDLNADIPLDKEKIYFLEVPIIEEEKPKKEPDRKKNDVLITFDTGPRIHREAQIKLVDATPLQKKLIKYQILKQITNKNWQRFYMCSRTVPEVDKASYYFKIIENHLKDDMKIETIDDSILSRFKNEIDKEIIRVFLIYQSKPKHSYF